MAIGPGMVDNLMKMIYAGVLRELIKEKVDDPNSEWDDFAMKKIDCVFGYEE